MTTDDDLDGVLFRFWCRAASYPGGWPHDIAKALNHCVSPDDYRAALMKLAQEKGVNLPTPSPDPRRLHADVETVMP